MGSVVLLVTLFSLYLNGHGYPLHPNNLPENEVSQHGNSFGFWKNTRAGGARWSYEDTGDWKNVASTCGGQSQSPINLDQKQSTLKSYEKFKFHNYGNLDKMTLINSGHSATFSVPSTLSADRTPYITDGGLVGRYNLLQFHLHWGKDSSRGSEHTIRNKKYAAELHLVHINSKYANLAAAVSQPDGLAVLGIFIQVGGRNENEYFKPLVDQLYEIPESGDEIKLSNLVALNKLLPEKTTSFYRYQGSLTTPNCEEIVTWTVFDEPITVTENQIDKFRQLFDTDGKKMVDNFRPPQDLNGRIVTYRPYHGCEIPKDWPLSLNAIAEAIAFKSCVVSFHANKFFNFFGLGSQ